MKWRPENPRPGDMIRIHLGQICHYGIYVSDDEIIQFGEPPVGSLVFRDSASVKVCVTTADAFACGQIVEVGIPDRAEARSRFPREKTVELARARIGEGGYNLIHNNCEHFVFECVFGIKRSTQEEEARRRWQERPVLNIFILPDGVSLPEAALPPAVEKHLKRKEPAARRVWLLLDYAVTATYNRPLTDYTPHTHLAGPVTFDGFRYDTAVCDGYTICAVSGTPVSVCGEVPLSGDGHTWRYTVGLPAPLTITVRNDRADCPVLYLADGQGGKTVVNNLSEGIQL